MRVRLDMGGCGKDELYDEEQGSVGPCGWYLCPVENDRGKCTLRRHTLSEQTERVLYSVLTSS